MKLFERTLKTAALKRGRAAAALLLCAAAAAAVGFGCSGGESSPFAPSSSVVINEVVTGGNLPVEGYTGSPDWFELYNEGRTAYDLSGCSVTDSGGASTRFVFPDGASLPAGGYLAVICDEAAGEAPEGMYIARFGLSKKGDSLILRDAEGNILQKLVIPALDDGVSCARMDNGSYGYCQSPTFCAANTGVTDEPPEADATQAPAFAEGALIISELRSGSEGWAELVNISSSPVALNNYWLSDDEADPLKYNLPDTALEPGEYIVIELNELDPEYPYNASFRLSRSEDTLYLYFADKRLADSMTIDPALPDCVSAVRDGDGASYTAHITKGYENSDKTFPALVWTEAFDEMPVIINEVLPDNKYGIQDAEGDRSDWLELYNRSEEEVSLAGYYLSDRADDPEKWALPDVTLGAGEYLIVFLSGKDCREGELHASFSISKKDAGVYLFNYDGMRFCGIEIPEGLNSNVSIGCGEDGLIHYYAAPTPGEENSTYGFNDFNGVGGFSPNGIYISEVSSVSAPHSGGSDWVELFNASGEDMDVSGWVLTTDPADPTAGCAFAEVFEAGRFIVTSALDGISATGDTIYLLDEQGGVRDVFKTGVGSVGVTSGRDAYSQTGERVFFTTPTKGSQNAQGVPGYAAEPVFGVKSLYCKDAFELVLTCATDGAEIRYTTDGSIPTQSSPLYSGRMTVYTNTVVRARAFREGLVPSAAVSHTYVFDEESSLPVVCISLSQSDYYTMYTAEGKENGGVVKGDEAACSVEYYIDGRTAFTTGAGVRVSGASTSLYAQKSLGLYFRAGYGRSSLDYPLFEGSDVSSFRSLVLRNGGQDVFFARLRDSYMSSICQGLALDVAYYRPVIVYVNGDYRGIYDLKENLNEDYVAAHYGVDRDSVDIIKRNSVLLAGSRTDWQSLRQFCQTADFSQQANYERLCELVDAESIMDYIAARTYFFDGDMFNQKYWRSEGTLKWRAVFFDSDYAMMGNYVGTNILPQYFNMNGVASAHGSKTNMDIYCALVQNAGWRDAFVLRYVYLVKYVFCPENALPIYDALVEAYEPEMARHIERWHFISSYEAWRNEAAALRRCIEQRPEYALRYVRSLFGLSDAQMADYERRSEALYAGGEDPGAAYSLPSAPQPIATPTPAPTAAQGPDGTPEPTAAPEP